MQKIPCYHSFGITVFMPLQIYQLRQERLNLSSNRIKEIRVARMFIPVGVVLLFCNFSLIFALYLIYSWGVCFREMWMMMVLSFQANSTANFFIYFYRGSHFRSEAQSMFSDWRSNFRFGNPSEQQNRKLVFKLCEQQQRKWNLRMLTRYCGFVMCQKHN